MTYTDVVEEIMRLLRRPALSERAIVLQGFKKVKPMVTISLVHPWIMTLLFIILGRHNLSHPNLRCTNFLVDTFGGSSSQKTASDEVKG